MSVWYAIPSKKPKAQALECVNAWRERGYKVAVWRDPGDEMFETDYLRVGDSPYPGYSVAVNTLCMEILRDEPDVDWIVTGGDDIWPDPDHDPQEIAMECSRHFSPEVLPHWKAHVMPGSTFGVMQPTGDRWGMEHGRAYIDHVCGSPWMGREFVERINGGRGPFWPEYTHMFPDEEMQEVCKLLGILWQRPDLKQEHRHWVREKRRMPDYLIEANSPNHWAKYQALFKNRAAAGFPGHEPLGEALVTVDVTKHHDLSDSRRYDFK